MYTEYTGSSPRGYRNSQMESIHTNNTTIPHSVFICFVSITLSILAFQLPLHLMTDSQSLCYLFTPHVIVYY